MAVCRALLFWLFPCVYLYIYLYIYIFSKLFSNILKLIVISSYLYCICVFLILYYTRAVNKFKKPPPNRRRVVLSIFQLRPLWVGGLFEAGQTQRMSFN